MKRCLFICTGNYYRSRYAEAIFNYEAQRLGLNWSAYSRGLAIQYASGDIASQTKQMLLEKKIPLTMTGPTRVQIHEKDFYEADRIIALQHHEHYPMMQEQYPDWADKIEYWDVADIGFVSARLALARIEQLVLEFIEKLEKEV